MRRYWLRTLNRAVQVGEGGMTRQAFRTKDGHAHGINTTSPWEVH